MNRQLIILLLITAIPRHTYAQTVDSLRMDSMIHALPEVMVRGERPIAKIKGSTITYDLSRLLMGKGVDNVYDALKYLPGVMKSGETITLGGQAATIIVDGKVTTLSAEELAAQLKATPAARLEKVEVIYTAPARMQVRGAVINVVLSHHNNDGGPLSAELNASWSQSHEASFSERGALLYQHGSLSMDVLYNHRHGKSYGWTDSRSHHILSSGDAYDVNSLQTNGGHEHGDDFHFALDYRIADQHKLSMVYTGRYNHDSSHSSTIGNIVGRDLSQSHNRMHNVRLDYELPIGLKTGVEMTYYSAPEEQWMESSLPTGNLSYAVTSSQRVNRWKAYLAEEKEVGKGWTVNGGAWMTTSINHSSQHYTDMETTTGSQPDNAMVRQHEDYVNIYGGASKDFNSRWSAEVSLAAEYYHSPAWNEWRIYPTLNITYKPAAGHMLQLGMDVNTNFPSYWATNNFVSYGNGGYHEVAGNPDLRPSKLYKASLLYLLHGKYQAKVWFQHLDKAFYQCPYQRSDRLAVVYQYVNFDYEQQLGAQIVVPFHNGRWWNGMGMAVGFWMRQKASHYFDLSLDREKVVGVVMLNNTFMLSSKPDVALSVDALYQSKAVQGIYDISCYKNVNASLRWTLPSNRLVLRVFCDNIFPSGRLKPSVDYKGQHLTIDFSSYRCWGVSVTYKLGGYKSPQREQPDMSRFR